MARSSAFAKADNSHLDSKIHVIAWSGGKDSTATVILFHEHEQELRAPDEEVYVLFYEVMFDKKHNISGHNPEMINFIHDKKHIFESWGYHVEALRSEVDFLDVFYHIMEKSTVEDRIGKHYGFPLGKGRCAVKRDCKDRPRYEWYKSHPGNRIEYVGIAADELYRLQSLHKEPNKVSLLENYGVTEEEAFNICREHGLLSPFYALDGQRRDGCWFCPHAKLVEHRAIKEICPCAWERYVSLEKEHDVAFPRWNVYSDETLEMRDEAIDEMSRYRQLSVFDFFDAESNV